MELLLDKGIVTVRDNVLKKKKNHNRALMAETSCGQKECILRQVVRKNLRRGDQWRESYEKSQHYGVTGTEKKAKATAKRKDPV